MKLIHCADLHLDSQMTKNLSKEQAKQRKKEMLRTFTRMVDYAHEYGAQAILIAGDLFDTRNVSATARNIVRDAIESHPQIDFLYLRGNHDNDNFLTKMDVIPENLKLFGEDWKSYRYGKVVISGLELSKSNQASRYHSLMLERDCFNIVTMHGLLTEYKKRDDVESISVNDLKGKCIDYLALGHLHTYQQGKLNARGVYCYPGCLEGRGFDECGEKGFVFLDVDEQTLEADIRFLPAAQRTLYTLPVDVTGVTSTQEAARQIEKTLAKAAYSQKSLVKFELVGEVPLECELNCDFLQDMFADYFYYEKVADKTKLAINYSDYQKDASLKGEFIRMVLGSDMSEDRKSEVIRCGILALSGEEI